MFISREEFNLLDNMYLSFSVHVHVDLTTGPVTFLLGLQTFNSDYKLKPKGPEQNSLRIFSD